MILNATNCKVIEKIYGTPFIEDWKGKTITVFVQRIRAFGSDVDALRIKPKVTEILVPHSAIELCKTAADLTKLYNEWKSKVSDEVAFIDLLGKRRKEIEQENKDQ